MAAAGVLFNDAPDRCHAIAAIGAAHMRGSAPPAFLPTLISDDRADQIARALDPRGRRGDRARACRASLGVHIEGPFINAAQAAASTMPDRIRPIDPDALALALLGRRAAAR